MDAGTGTGISLSFLGTGTAVPWRGRAGPGLALRVETAAGAELALIDPSAGASHRLAACGYRFEELGHVLFTHYHPDHCGDLAPLLFALKNPALAARRRGRRLRLVGPPGLQALMSALGGIYGKWIDQGAELEILELDGRRGRPFFRLGALEGSAFPVEHTDNSLAYRFERRGGATLVYSGDTGHCPGVVDAAREADLLILECSCPEGRGQPGHLTPSEAGRIAAAAGARRLLLTHLYPECHGEDLMTPCRRQFRGEVALAEDGLTLHL